MNDALEDVEACICTLNEVGNIAECIASLRAAGVVHIHVVDAQSPDGTAEAAEQLGVRVTRSEKGLASQRQTGCASCRKPYLLFVDADDRLAPDCVRSLLSEIAGHKAEAVQASLRVLSPGSYWQRGMDAVLRHCICRPGPTNMVGRPALYRLESLRRVGMDTRFDGAGNEDAALSIRMTQAGMGQWIGTGQSFRKHPATFAENARAWLKYGRGDARLIVYYPSRTLAVLHHLLVRYLLVRSAQLVRCGNVRLVGFTVCCALVRLAGLCAEVCKIFVIKSAGSPQHPSRTQP